jgi:hypothetical protein
LVVETEAFLCGHYVDHADELLPRPVAWIECNWIAHADPEEVCRAARRAAGPDVHTDAWVGAIQTLLHELMRLADGDARRVAALQREWLIPVELAVMTGEHRDLAPSAFVAMALERLRYDRMPGQPAPGGPPT